MSFSSKHIFMQFFFSVFFLVSLISPVTAQTVAGSTTLAEACPPASTTSTLFLLEKAGKYGYINNQGNIVLPLTYDALSLPDAKGHIIVKEKGNYGIFDQTGRQILPPAFKDLKIGFDGNIYASQGKLQGVFNTAGQPILPMEFESCQPCTGGLILAKKDKLWHYYDSVSGKIAIEQGFDEAAPFVEGLARVKCGDKYGYIDPQGKILIPCQYKDAADFSEGLAAVTTKDRWGFIDSTGKMIIPETFSGYESGFSEGLAIVHGASAHDYIDKKGNLAFSAPYEIVYPFKDGLAEINVEKVSFSWGGLISSALSSALNVYIPDEDRNLIASNMKRGFVDKTGKQLIPTTYDFVSSFQDGLAKVILHDKTGFVDHRGNFVIPTDYQELS
ncbi:MAG: WG repeat-containing protein, partial [Selenomonadaceae bacterium]